MVPAISRWEWHPFSIVSQASDGRLLATVKRFGSFTTQLHALLAAPHPVAMRVHCPIEPMEPSWEGEDATILFVGGVGSASAFIVTSHILLARDKLMKRGEARGGAGVPGKVYFVWSARDPSDFFSMDSDLAIASWCVGEGEGARASALDGRLRGDGLSGRAGCSADDVSRAQTASFAVQASDAPSLMPFAGSLLLPCRTHQSQPNNPATTPLHPLPPAVQ